MNSRIERQSMTEENQPSCNLVKAQVIRGIIGVALLIPAALLFASYPLVSIGLIVASVFPLRGCPLCWTVGMYETLDKSKRAKAEAGRNSSSP
jgi:hypothetical protein